jgi:hypothetical protein
MITAYGDAPELHDHIATAVNESVAEAQVKR